MNAFEKRLIGLLLIISFMFGAGIVYTQTPPATNTIEQGEGVNFPTITATNGYFYGTPAVNVTDQLYGDFGTLDITGGDILGTSLTTAGNVVGGAYYIGATEVTPVLQYPREGANYILWVTGGVYYLKNSATAVVTSNANFDTLTASLFSPNAGLIYVFPGTYLFAQNITIKDRTILQGAGYDAVTFQRSANGAMFILDSSVSWVESITINDITIHGNSKTGDLVRVVDGRGMSLNRVRIANSAGNGLRVLTGAWGLQANRLQVNGNNIGVLIEANGVVIRDSIIRQNVVTNIRINSKGYSSKIVDCVIEKASQAGAYNFEITGGTYEAYASHLISGCTFEDAPTGGGNIKIYSKTSVQIKGVQITGCFLSEDGTSIRIEDALDTEIYGNFFYSTGTGINIQATSTNTRIGPNNVFSCTTPISDSGVTTRINQNEGYVTEKSSTDTILNGTTSIVITHGLSYTPTSGNTAWTVSYLENPTNDPGSWWIDTFTATQATIHVFRDPGVSHLDIAWSARRTP